MATPTPAHTLAEALGISKNDLKKMRADLTPEVDWIAGQPILYTQEGVKKIRAALGLPEAASADTGKPEPPGPPIREQLVVIRPAKGNTRIVHCRTADLRPVLLAVKNNANFTPGMMVPNCVQRPISAEQYAYEGRLPRRKGRF